jgi:hypothetical protein
MDADYNSEIYRLERSSPSEKVGWLLRTVFGLGFYNGEPIGFWLWKAPRRERELGWQILISWEVYKRVLPLVKEKGWSGDKKKLVAYLRLAYDEGYEAGASGQDEAAAWDAFLTKDRTP